jgi:hypothetical protein
MQIDFDPGASNNSYAFGGRQKCDGVHVPFEGKGCGGEKKKDHYGEYKRFEKGNMCNAAQKYQLLTQVFGKMQ